MKDDKAKPMTERQARQLTALGVPFDRSWSVHQANRAANAAIVNREATPYEMRVDACVQVIAKNPVSHTLSEPRRIVGPLSELA